MEAASGVVKGKSRFGFRDFTLGDFPLLLSFVLTFHTASEEDIPALRTLATHIWGECYEGIISREQMAYMLEWMYSAETMRREISEGVLWEIVRLDGRDAGYCSVTFGAEDVAKLNKLYLLPMLQGQGHGQAMLARVFALAETRAAKEVRLQVNKANVRALRAYERFGFARIEEGVFDIGGGYVMDDYILSKPVAASPGATYFCEKPDIFRVETPEL